jgi:hypothetical protein
MDSKLLCAALAHQISAEPEAECWLYGQSAPTLRLRQRLLSPSVPKRSFWGNYEFWIWPLLDFKTTGLTKKAA